MAQITGTTAIFFQSFDLTVTTSIVMKTIILPIRDYSQFSKTFVIELGRRVSGFKLYNQTLTTILRLATEEAGNGVNMVQRTAQYWG